MSDLLKDLQAAVDAAAGITRPLAPAEPGSPAQEAPRPPGPAPSLPPKVEENPKLRNTYIGGTDVATICGKSSHKDPLDVYLAKTGKAAETPKPEHMAWGLLLECTILGHYCTIEGLILESLPWVRGNPETWLGGHGDGVAYQPGTHAEVATLANPRGRRLLECKNVAASQRHLWTGGPPVDYVYQGQLYLHLYGLQLATFVVLFGGNDMRTFHMERDPKIIEEIIRECGAFWREHIVRGVPPTPRTEPPVASAGGKEARAIQADSAMRAALARLTAARDLRRKAEQVEEEVKELIGSYIGTDRVLAVGNGLLAWWQEKSRAASVTKAATWKQLHVSSSEMIQRALDIAKDTEEASKPPVDGIPF